MQLDSAPQHPTYAGKDQEISIRLNAFSGFLVRLRSLCRAACVLS